MSFSFKIDGLDRIQKRLDDITNAIASLEGEITKVSITPGDEASAAAAIAKINSMIDERVGPLKVDPVVESIVAKMKTAYAAGIRSRAGLSK